MPALEEEEVRDLRQDLAAVRELINRHTDNVSKLRHQIKQIACSLTKCIESLGDEQNRLGYQQAEQSRIMHRLHELGEKI